MRITRVVLTNCGLHESLKFDCDNPTVGICGVNGSGKSTVLEMIRYALTGETADNIDTYVKQGAANGQVDVTFRKQGATYTVSKRFGKSPKRSLTRPNGDPLTKVKDIDQFLGTLLGADRLAMNSAIFIGQGKLPAMLFRGDADRRSMFIKLVNLGYCATRAEVAGDMASEVGAQLANLEPVLLSAEELLSAREAEMATLLTRQQGFSDWSAEVAELNQRSRLSGQRDELERQASQAATAVQSLEQQDNRADTVQLEQEQAKLTANQGRRQLLADMLNKRRQMADEHRRWLGLNEKRSVLVDELNQLKAKPVAAPADQDINAWLETLTILKTLLPMYQELRVATQDRRTVAAQLKITRDSIPSLESLVENRNEALRTTTELFNLQNNHLKFQQELRRCFQTEGRVDRATCPKCQLTVVDLVIPDQAALDALVVEVKETATLQAKVQRELGENTAKVRTACAQVSAQEQQLRTLDAQLLRLDNALKDAPAEEELIKDIAATSAKVAQYDTQQTAWLQWNQAVTTREARLSELDQQMAGAQSWKKTSADNLLAENIQKVAHQLVELDEVIKQNHVSIQSMRSYLEALEGQRQQHQRLLNELTEVDGKLQAALSERLALLLQEHQSMAAVQTIVEAQQTGWNESRQTRATAQAALDAARNQVNDIRARMEQDQERRLLMKDLLKIKDLFAESGLPTMVVGQYFQLLSVVTRRQLQMLNPTFRIEVDPVNPLSFRFERTDRPEGWLEMCKLSGGQKVRLCLAFLMAVQEVLVPDVGLLVLDEVSDSLDQEGVESLADLLAGMEGRLHNSDHQLWVVDHRPEIARSLPVRLDLQAP